MNNCINVQKLANGFSITINVPANQSSCYFVSDFTGAITSGELTNVATININGVSLTYPYQLTLGVSYKIDIVQTSSAAVSAVKLIAKDIDAASKTINVADYSVGDGRYLYILNKAGTKLYKIDANLLAYSNYAGAGSWTISPIISTIVLPTLPNSAIYSGICFTRDNKILLAGTDTTTFKVYCSYVLPNDSVYNIILTSINSYTTFNLGSLKYGVAYGVMSYDFINNIVYVVNASGVNGTSVVSINLTTNTATNLGYTGYEDSVIFHAAYRPWRFDPYRQYFCGSNYGSMIYSIITQKVNGYIYGSNGGVCCGYVKSLDKYCKYNQGLYNLTFYNLSGNATANISITDRATSMFVLSDLIVMDKHSQVFGISQNSYSIINYSTGSGICKDSAYSDSAQYWATGSNYTGKFYTLSGLKRLLTYDAAQTIPQFGYLEFSENLNAMVSNQLII